MNKATFRCTTDPTVERYRCCGERVDGTGCTCDDPPTTAAERQRRAAMKVEPVEEFDSLAAPDPYAAQIAAQRAARGLPPLPEQRPSAPVHMRKFPLRPNPAPDGYAARISALRKQRGFERTNLPADYDPSGPPPDPYAATLTALRAEVA